MDKGRFIGAVKHTKLLSAIAAALISLLSLPLVRSVFKIIFKRFIGPARLPIKYALYCPAIGKIDLSLPGGERFTMYGDGKDPVANSLYWLGVDRGYEYETIKIWADLAKRADVIFDIGAYSGVFSLAAAAVNHGARIFAFEPADVTYEYLSRNVSMNGCNNITAIKKAVSDKDGAVTLTVPFSPLLPFAATTTDTVRRKDIKRAVTVDSVCVDSFVKDNGIGKVDLVKIDVEGAEPGVLEGMRATIKMHRPKFIIEVLPGEKTQDFLPGFFKPYGYAWYLLTDEGPVKKDVIKGDPMYIYLNWLFVKEAL
jgi:FkbM family methyltransferase